MMTGAKVGNAAYVCARRGALAVAAWCTAGCSNALRAGDRATVADTRPGTINLIVAINEPLRDAALAEAIQIATEARVLAVQQAGTHQHALGTARDRNRHGLYRDRGARRPARASVVRQAYAFGRADRARRAQKLRPRARAQPVVSYAFHLSIPMLAAALALDLMLGDPRWLPHPVRALGMLIERGEHLLRTGDARRDLVRGAILTACVVGVSVGAAWAIVALANWIHPLVGALAAIGVAWTTLALRGLDQAAGAVEDALAAGDDGAARRAIPALAGRDPDALDRAGMAQACVESVAENASDGVIAPLLYLFAGGPVAAIAYKAINTLDSMIGYRDERYLYFGRVRRAPRRRRQLDPGAPERDLYCDRGTVNRRPCARNRRRGHFRRAVAREPQCGLSRSRDGRSAGREARRRRDLRRRSRAARGPGKIRTRSGRRRYRRRTKPVAHRDAGRIRGACNGAIDSPDVVKRPPGRRPY